MQELDRIWTQRLFDAEPSYTRRLGAMFQPDSQAEFNAHPEFDEVFRRWTQGDNFRGLDKARVWSLILNIKQVLKTSSGALAELGVYKGQCSALMSYYAEKFGRTMYLLDTFSGFSTRQFEEGMEENKAVAFKDTSLECAQAVVGSYRGNRWVVGMFPESVTQEMRDEKFAFVSIDCDIYEPIREGLKFFWPRMVAGGMIFVHDYSSGYWPGATRATDEFCEANKARGMLLPDFSGSYVLIKQGD